MVAPAADIDRDNYRVFLSEHDIDRTLRIYKALADLSDKALKAPTQEILRNLVL